MINFSYGSNLNTGWLRERVPGATPRGPASLRRFELRFHKRSNDRSAKADIVATGDSNDVVWGVIYEIPDAEKPLLDRAEGLNQGYAEKLVTVTATDGQSVDALAYVATRIDSSRRPYAWYRRLVIEGARGHGLSEDYIARIEAEPTVLDTDEDRVARASRFFEYGRGHLDLSVLSDLGRFAMDFLGSYHYTRPFADKLLAVTLCQGAANHVAVESGLARGYADLGKAGVKDLDVWLFFQADGHRFNPRWSQSRDFGPSKLGANPLEPSFLGRRVDFFGRSIAAVAGGAEAGIERWLRGRSTSPRALRRKAVIGLEPRNLLGKAIWVNPEIA